jgi:hypothetical protein
MQRDVCCSGWHLIKPVAILETDAFIVAADAAGLHRDEITAT